MKRKVKELPQKTSRSQKLKSLQVKYLRKREYQVRKPQQTKKIM